MRRSGGEEGERSELDEQEAFERLELELSRAFEGGGGPQTVPVVVGVDTDRMGRIDVKLVREKGAPAAVQAARARGGAPRRPAVH